MKQSQRIMSLLIIALLTVGLVVSAKSAYFTLYVNKGSEKHEKLTYSYSYITVKGLSSDSVANKINGVLKEDKDKTFFSLKMKSNPKYNGTEAQNIAYKNVNTLNTPKVLSFKATTALQSGEKETPISVKGFTFNPADGKLYGLSELFTDSSSEYKTILKMYVDKVEDDEFKEKAKKEIKSSQDYYLTDDDLVLLFESDVDQKVFEVKIKLSELKDILKENFH